MNSGSFLRSFRNDRLTGAHVLAAAVMVAVGIVATWPAWRQIYQAALKDKESSQIFIVPLVALYLIFVRRIRLRFCPPNGRIVGPVMVGVGWVLGSFGFYNGIRSLWLWELGAIVVALGCALSVLGKNVIFRFFPAMLVLLFLVPVPVHLRLAVARPLEVWTASVADRALEIIGVGNADVYGNTIWINGQPVNIAEACNGMQMVFSLTLVCFAFSFALPLRNLVRVLILLASPLAAIFCNLLRILPTVWLYGYASQRLADRFHDYSGWLMLPVAFLMLYCIIKLLQWAMIPLTEYPLAGQ